ncbi:MAG TPA: hypothetical protein VE197_10225 [Mycobacterium sp.]|nr:hypothetical protein [Mycobacterium sp.]
MADSLSSYLPGVSMSTRVLEAEGCAHHPRSHGRAGVLLFRPVRI